MNTKTITALVLATTFAAPSIAQACPDTTPVDAAAQTWESRSTLTYPNNMQTPINEELYLSNASVPAQWWYPSLPGNHRGYLVSVPDYGGATVETASWIMDNGFFVRVNHHASGGYPSVRFSRVQLGHYDHLTESVVEGVDVSFTGPIDNRQVHQAGLFNLGQGYDPGAPISGMPVNLDGQWCLTDEWTNFGRVSNTYTFSNGAITGPVPLGNYAAVTNSLGQTMIAIVTLNGRVLGGEMTINGQNQLAVDPADAVGLTSEIGINAPSMSSDSDYDMCVDDSRRLVYFSLVPGTC